MLQQHLAQGFAQDAHAAAMHDANAGEPARKARSTNFSTSREASSTVWPMTLISVGTAAVSLWRETEIPRARAAFTGESGDGWAPASTAAMSSRAIFIFMTPISTSK